MDEIKRNGSGYYDETAYKAIKNVENVGAKMEYKRGEMYWIRFSNGESKKAVIVSADERAGNDMLNTLILAEEPKGALNVPIVCGGKMYADCGMVSFIYRGRIDNYIRTATEEEMQEIDAGIIMALGLDKYPDPTETVSNYRIKGLQKELERAVGTNKRLEIENRELRQCANYDRETGQDLLKVRTERDLYKSLYEQLFERMLGK